jgi:hypothetical protein
MPVAREIRRWLLLAVLAPALGFPVAADEFADALAERLRQEVKLDAALIDIKVAAHRVQPRKFVPGQELVVVCPGVAEARLAEVEKLAVELARESDEGQKWLERNTVVAVSAEPPAAPAGGDPRQAEQRQRQEEEALVGKLIRETQEELEQDPELRGAIIRDIEFAPAKDRQIAMKLTGNVVGSQQRARVEAIVRDHLAHDAAWQPHRRRIVVSAESLGLRKPNKRASDRYLEEALQAYRNGDFAEAETFFSLAIADDPQNEILPLWKIVTASAQEDEARAKRGLTLLLRKDKNGFSSPQIARHFEKVQGPVRARIVKWEQDLLKDLAPP